MPLSLPAAASNCQSSIINRQLTWHLWIDQQPRPGWQNMAIDLALLQLAAESGRAVLRLYQWKPHCLSFGRHEPALRRYGRERVEALGIDVVRRPTGGRAVWHARELTYAVAAPALLGSLRETYRTIHQLFAGALQSLGVAARLAEAPRRTPGPADGACFAAPVGGEVLVDGRKMVGSAQLRLDRAFLQHGSLLLSDDQSLVRRLSGERDDLAPELPLSQAIGRQVEFGEAADVVARTAARWTGPWEELEDTGPVVARAEAHATQFRSPAWTWER